MFYIACVILKDTRKSQPFAAQIFQVMRSWSPNMQILLLTF